ncbi:unnamed protein product [Aspergillus oryzae RIB40]|uniref:Mitochondrial thiamine pyrophosphate carrier 1 n=1 Tax=Aspergillus oryzae (strain ATCC 42149 / RIB 40) TaxID=510516 RepID=Q2UDB1_ASPOR|nr:unnamed protein product [Aspergillus oryzae RIB40]BAE60454.1 unnamed protein product [Aspergillus oryzae RIB40]
MAPGESKDERDERVTKLWQSLGARKDGRLDLNGLKKGLKKIDHPLKNADSMLQNVLKAVDTNGDGYIDYSAAFSKADVTVSSAKLDAFFADVDTNSDGVISYPEWRDFLLFLPAYSNLRAVLSYYTATGNLNPEGDVHINDLQGLGTDHSFPKRYILAIKNLLYNILPVHVLAALIPAAYAEVGGALNFGVALENDSVLLDGDSELEWLPVPRTVAMWMSFRYYERKLTENTPQLGYFIAGGIAGAVSRTATAPLDRLKVYLIAQTGAKSAAVCAAKDGAPLRAAGNASKSLADAVKELWRAGGIRSLFAGNGLNVLKVMPESAIKFGAYESAKRAFARLEGHNDPKQLAPTSQFLSGGCGGMVAQYVKQSSVHGTII